MGERNEADVEGAIKQEHCFRLGDATVVKKVIRETNGVPSRRFLLQHG
jgi:hypothetical protein